MIAVLAVAALAMLAAVALSRPNQAPAAERVIYRILAVAAWLEHVGTALDAALLRYRMERIVLRIELASTRQREQKFEPCE